MAVQRLAFILILVSTTICAAAAQEAQPESPDELYGTGAGLEIILTNSGFGLGGYYRQHISPTSAVITHISIGAGKDEREAAFFDRFGRKDIPNKANYLLMLPAQVGVQRRLFRNSIEDNFRPFVHISAGPTVGWEYPYFDDANGSGSLEDDEEVLGLLVALGRGAVRIGAGSTFAIGAHFGTGKRRSQGLRVGYTLTYFKHGIQLLEAEVQGRQRFIGTPTINVVFGPLL